MQLQVHCLVYLVRPGGPRMLSRTTDSNLWCIGPLVGDTFLFRFSQQLPHLRLKPFTFFFELTRRPSRALNLTLNVVSETSKMMDIVRMWR